MRQVEVDILFAGNIIDAAALSPGDRQGVAQGRIKRAEPATPPGKNSSARSWRASKAGAVRSS